MSRFAPPDRASGEPQALVEEDVRRHLATGWLGERLVCSAETDSTNSDAASLGRQGAPSGTVVIADAQRAGRGRLGRSWVSRPGVNLYMSVLLRPSVRAEAVPQLSLVAGVAVAAALEGQAGQAGQVGDPMQPLIKWPNDVLVSGRKICGILTEVEAHADGVEFVVVGIGVNLNSTREDFPEELRDKATSVLIERGRPIARAPFAARLLGELERCCERFADGGLSAISAEWHRRAALLGSLVTVSGAGAEVSGRCLGIDEDGALLLEDDTTAADGQRGRVRRVLAGDVTVIGGYTR